MRKTAILIVALMMIGTGLLSGCQEQSNPLSIPLNPSRFVVMSQYQRDTLEGANRVGYVDVTVKNNGGKGSGTVYVTARQGNNIFRQQQTILLGENEEQALTFRFEQIDFWTANPWYFTVNVVN
jgi:hypothetical protein